MTEVILNDECMHCNDRECHNGEHFCNYAMKDNSFYKNAKLYKGLEVIQRPTYEDLEKENAELKARINNLKDEFKYSENYGKRVQNERHRLVNDNAKLRDQLTKAKELLKKVVSDFYKMNCVTVHIDKTIAEAEKFLNSEVEK